MYIPLVIRNIIIDYERNIFDCEKKEKLHEELLKKRKMIFCNEFYSLYENHIDTDEINYYINNERKLICYNVGLELRIFTNKNLRFSIMI
jgi:hypothetical protein